MVADAHIGDIDFPHKRRQDEVEIDHASEWANEMGVHRPIKDGLENDGSVTLSDDEDSGPPNLVGDSEDDTSEEERELPGTRRPRRGEGWWGIGKPLQPQRKGLNKDFTDGAGLPSPGRWTGGFRRTMWRQS